MRQSVGMMRVLPLLLLVAGCAPRMANIPATPIPIEVTYEAGPCYGRCPAYSVTLASFGQPGVFEGKRFTAVIGRRDVPVTFAQFDRFYGALSEARGADARAYAVGGPNCQAYVTDQPTVTVTFREGSSQPWTFRFDYGCRDPQNAKLAAALRRAPTLLPIGDLIGPRN